MLLAFLKVRKSNSFDDNCKPFKKVASTTKVGNTFSKVGNVVVSDNDGERF